MGAHSPGFFTWVVVASVLCGGSAGVANEEPPFVRVTPTEVQWRDIPGNESAVVQIIGEGPAQTVQVDAKEPTWRVVP
jgi:hypothetical protein